MKIGIIDAEIMGKSKHRFPNLACMKISSYYNSIGNEVELCLNWEDINCYDKVFISKVFIKTELPDEEIYSNGVAKTEQTAKEYYKNHPYLNNPNIVVGGTGFFYEVAPKLDSAIEHSMPDYHLYDEWVKSCIKNGAKEKEFTYYKDYSIGFLTRGCFRQCQFCVNKNYKQCKAHSNLNEFMDKDRPKLCFLDDNFFACPNWREIIQDVLDSKKRFQFKQGLDERLLTDEKIHCLSQWDKKYDGDFIFAFDNIEDKDLIVSKLERIYELYPNFKHQMKFYCFCGFDRNNVYDEDFWTQDLEQLFERIFILSKYSCFPYVMRHENYKNSPYANMYISIASWVNQPSIFKAFDFKTYCICHGMKAEGYAKYKRDIKGYLSEYNVKYASWRNFEDFEKVRGKDFKEELNTLPQSIVKFGRWKNK